MSLFDDPRVVEAAARAMADVYGEGSEEWHPEHAPAILTAAVAALPREEIVEKAARAIARVYDEPFEEWHVEKAPGLLADLGLIPEHVTPEEDPT